MELPKRKPTRIKEYDYSTAGAYFVTVCTKDRKQILSSIVGGDAHIAPCVRLTQYGKIVDKYIKNEPQITHYVIMPNHIHMIIEIDGPMWASVPTKSVISIVRSIKILTTKEIGHSIWQRSFHDHIIRNEKDYKEIAEYIENNPAKWAEDCFHPNHSTK